MNNNNDKPRKNINQSQSKTAIAIRNLKAEITPTVRKYTPSPQPGVIKPGSDGSWTTKKIRLSKSLAAGASSSINFTVGDAVTELFGTAATGSLAVNFYVEQLSVWNLGNGTSTATSLNLASNGGLANTSPLNVSDFGTNDRPAAVGQNIPRALASQYLGVNGSSTSILFTVKRVVEFAGVTTASTIVADLWVVYQN